MKNKIMSAAVAAAALFCAPTDSHAALLNGQSVQFQWLFPNISTTCAGSATAVVGAGVEFGSNSTDSCGSGNPILDMLSVDLSDTQILVSFTENYDFSNVAFNGFRIRDVNSTIPAFTGLSLLDERGPFTSSRLSFDANNIYFNFSNLEFDGSGDNRDFIRVGVTGAAVTSVPEPATLALLGLGLAGLGLVRRKRQA